jgi:hypothetical protein
VCAVDVDVSERVCYEFNCLYGGSCAVVVCRNVAVVVSFRGGWRVQMLKHSIAGVGSFALHPRRFVYYLQGRPSRCVLARPAGVARSRLLFDHQRLLTSWQWPHFT